MLFMYNICISHIYMFYIYYILPNTGKFHICGTYLENIKYIYGKNIILYYLGWNGVNERFSFILKSRTILNLNRR